MQKFKFLILCLFSAFVIFILPNGVFANFQNNSEFTYEEYLSGVENGWVAEDVTYEELLKIREDSKGLEKVLEESYNFHEILDHLYLLAGDMLITNGTSSLGLLGHAAIALDNKDLFHIQGTGYHPEIITKEDFVRRYGDENKGWIRPKNTKRGSEAAHWIYKTY